MSKKDDTSKALKKKLKKLKKLEVEIATLKEAAAKKSQRAKAKDAENNAKKSAKKDTKKDDKKDSAKKKKTAKSASKSKHKAGKKQDGKKTTPENVSTPSTPSLVRSEPVKAAAKDASSAALAPSARVAAG